MCFHWIWRLWFLVFLVFSKSVLHIWLKFRAGTGADCQGPGDRGNSESASQDDSCPRFVHQVLAVGLAWYCMLKHLLSRRLAYFMKFAGAWRSQWLRARNGKTFFTLMLSLSSELLPLDQKVFLGPGQKRTFVCGDYRGFPSRQKERSRYYQWRMAGKIEISVKRSYFWRERRWWSRGAIRVKLEEYHASGPAVAESVPGGILLRTQWQSVRAEIFPSSSSLSPLSRSPLDCAALFWITGVWWDCCDTAFLNVLVLGISSKLVTSDL